MTGWVPFRIAPKMPVGAYQTYQSVRPRATHTRKATCLEVGCRAQQLGWATRIDVSTPLGRRQAAYIRMKSGRAFTVTGAEPTLTFTFPAGQTCFADHLVGVDRPALFIKQGGDWRAHTSPPVRMRAVDWVDDFANHQADLAEKIERG